MKDKHHFISYVILALLLLLLLILTLYIPGLKEFFQPGNLRNFVLSAGIFAFLIYIVLLALSVPLPIPSAPVLFAGGYIFGIGKGFVFGLVGITLGAIAYFSIGRYGGLSLAKKMVDQHHLDHFNIIFKKRGPSIALLLYAIPIFPADELNLLLGLTRMTYPQLVFTVIAGYIPRILVINTFGSYLQAGFNLVTIVTFLIAVLFILMALFREKLKAVFFKELKQIKKDAKKIKKRIANHRNKHFKRR